MERSFPNLETTEVYIDCRLRWFTLPQAKKDFIKSEMQYRESFYYDQTIHRSYLISKKEIDFVKKGVDCYKLVI